MITEKTDAKTFISNLREIYFWLEDDISKIIFEKKFEYYITKKNSSIGDIVAQSSEGVQNILKQYNQTILGYDIPQNEQVIIYGANYGGAWLLRYVMSTNNIIFCDYENKNIVDFMGYPIISKEELLTSYKSTKIILGSMNWRSLYYGLIEDGILEENITIGIYMDEENQYFDEVIKFSDDEVFVDVGVMNAHTSIQFAKRCDFKYKHIHLFEADIKNYDWSLKNLEQENIKNYTLHNIGLWNEKATLKFDTGKGGKSKIDETSTTTIEVNTMDKILNDEKVTFIKMDIEGAELNALKGAEKIILSNKPKLAISIYHKYEDLVDILMYIKSLVPEYKFYIRHYSNILVETILYAVI